MGCRRCGCPTSRRVCRQCDIEDRAEERAKANARLDQDDDDEEGEDPVPLPDGGQGTPVTDDEVDHWVDLVETHADGEHADRMGGIHEKTLIELGDLDRGHRTVARHLRGDDRVTRVLGFGPDGTRGSWAPAGSDIGIGEDVTPPNSAVADGGREPCVVCNHTYDRDEHDECPQCNHTALDEFGDVDRGEGIETDGGRVAHPADAALADAGVGDQQYCPYGDAACARGEIPCFGCLTGGEDDA